ncbi:hypothetical protein HBB16_03975 [Pseudonocardia sp. MCCB 268]|nr:hypothetical protein [Pseudonocardia cytotoxica]
MKPPTSPRRRRGHRPGRLNELGGPGRVVFVSADVRTSDGLGDRRLDRDRRGSAGSAAAEQRRDLPGPSGTRVAPDRALTNGESWDRVL